MLATMQSPLKAPIWLLILISVSSFAQSTGKPITNEDVVNLVKASVPTDTIVLTIRQSKTAFDTSPNAIIALSQNGVTGPVLNAVLTASASPGPAPVAPVGLDAPCPEKSGVYFNDGATWKPVPEAASAGSETKPVLGGAKSSVVYIGAEAQTVTSAQPTFCFREIKPDLGITIVRLEKKKDHRELQTSLYSGFLTPGVGSGVKMKNIVHVSVRPAKDEDDVSVVQSAVRLEPGEYLILAQNPIFATMPASVPMSMRLGIGYDFRVK
jgi:hypothetical protein